MSAQMWAMGRHRSPEHWRRQVWWLGARRWLPFGEEI
jgi:hypothetical protein